MNLKRFGDPNFRQLEPDGELAKPTPGSPTSRIAKRGSSLRITSADWGRSPVRASRLLNTAASFVTKPLSGRAASIAHDAILKDSLVCVEPHDKPFGIDADEAALAAEPVNQVPVGEVVRFRRLP